MAQVWSDFVFGLRSLAKARGFAVAAIGTLALAIALETSVIAVVNAYLIRALPYPAADRLYRVNYAPPQQQHPRGLSGLDWAALSDVIEHPIAWDLDYFYLLGGSHPEAAAGAWITPGFMHGLGIQPVIGRAFVREEFEPGAPQVAMISHSLWLSRFGGDSAVLGRRFEAYVSDRPNDPALFTIVGVLPVNFWHLNRFTHVLTPLRASSYPYLVRLKKDVPPALAAQRMTALVRGGVASLPNDYRVEVRSLHEDYASRVKPMLQAIGASVTLVLLIACANVAFLVLIRGMRRQKEVAVRLALGAGQTRVARMLVMESLLLAFGAALVGILASLAALRLLAPVIERQLGPTVPGGPAAMSIDLTVITLVGSMSLLIALVLTLAPLLITWRQPLFTILRSGVRGGDRPQARRARFALVSLEIAGSLALLVGSGLMVKTVLGLLETESGMNPRGVMTGGIALRQSSYPSTESRGAFFERLLRGVSQKPGVSVAALSSPPPFSELEPRPIGTEATTSESPGMAGIYTVTPDFFAALGIPVRQGRAFVGLDRGSSDPVAIVSETAARRLWPDGRALGKSVRLMEQLGDAAEPALVSRRVVGVAADVRHSPTDEQSADVYIPLLQHPGRFATLILRTTGTPEAEQDGLRSLMKEIDPEVSVSFVRRLEDIVGEQFARPRFLAAMFTGFGLFATILAVLGLYGVIAYAVKQREHEVAVRIALGADGRAIMNLFMRDGARVLIVGSVAGVLGAVAIGRLLESQLYGVKAVDPVTLILASLTLIAACLAAVWWPARRASGVDPSLTLREE